MTKDYSDFFKGFLQAFCIVVALGIIFCGSQGCSFLESGNKNSLYDGRIRVLYLDNEPCGKIQFRTDGGIAIADCPRLAKLVTDELEEE